MINLECSVSTIERLLDENSDSSLTYAALECRLAIERICYERLRLAHDYISHDDLKKWQPSDIVKVLIKEVDSNVASTFTLSISKEPLPEGSSEPTLEEYQAQEFVPIGTQIGFNANKLGKLWNGLANLALHISIPVNKNDTVSHYGNAEKTRKKVQETLEEIKRISKGTLGFTGFGEEVSFDCLCDSKNKRKLGLLENGQIVSCINPKCDESFEYVKRDTSFVRRTFAITCKKCDKLTDIPKKMVERLRSDQHIHFECEGCGEKIFIQFKPMQAQTSIPK